MNMNVNYGGDRYCADFDFRIICDLCGRKFEAKNEHYVINGEPFLFEKIRWQCFHTLEDRAIKRIFYSKYTNRFLDVCDSHTDIEIEQYLEKQGWKSGETEKLSLDKK